MERQPLNPLDVLKSVGELCVMYWYERQDRLKEWVTKVCTEVDENIQELPDEEA